MSSTVTTLPSLDATDPNVNVDDIDTDIADSIVGSVVKDEPRVDEDSISASGLIVRDDIAEAKASTTKTASTDTAKSLNESNNKIIKELDDETAKTFPQIVSEVKLICCSPFWFNDKFNLNHLTSERLISISNFFHCCIFPFHCGFLDVYDFH